MVDSVHGAHVSQQSLSCADVASGLFTTNVLLAGLKSQTSCIVTQSVLGKTNETTGNLTLVLFAAGKERCVGATEAEWNTESLSVSEGYVCAKLARGSENSESQKVGGHTEGCLQLVNLLGKVLEVLNTTKSVRVLAENTNQVFANLFHSLASVLEDVIDLNLDSEAFGAGSQYGNGLRVAQVRNKVDLVGALLTS